MKKNLKKVISAVIAMALAASMIPATLAANVALSDVADTASYATAVNTLVALGVINGYEDGTFLPDNNITRAEVSKVMVAALNKLADAEKRAGSTQFTDVAADHWASGFINVGVSNKIVNGMGDGTFAPEANVTIAQVVKMLAAAMGYEQYAKFLGEGKPNWYDGWMDAADAAGFTDNVNAGAEDAATRAEVAQLVYDALLTPIVEENGYEYSDGKYVPKIAVQDGVDSTYYKTLLTEKFDAYYVEGYVLSKAMEDGQMKVTFGIADSEKYAESDIRVTSDMPVKDLAEIDKDADYKGIKQEVYAGDTTAADSIGIYASAIIKIDDGDMSLISFVPSGKNKTVTFDATDIDKKWDATDITSSEKFIKVNGTEYKLADTLKLYINGYKHELTTLSDAATLEKYVKTANVGTVELVDTYKTDGKYDTIFVNNYATGKVDAINASSGKITLKNVYGAKAMAANVTLVLDYDDENAQYNIYKGGEEITLAEIKKGDVLSVAYKVSLGASDLEDDLEASDKYYDIYVSDETASGRLTRRDYDDAVITVGGTEYGVIDDKGSETNFNNAYKIGNDYTLSIDAFGRVYTQSQDSSSVTYAIATRMYYSSGDQAYKLYVYTADGTTKSYVIDEDVALTIGATPKTSNLEKEIYERMYEVSYGADSDNNTNANYNNLEATDKRVVTYKVSTRTGFITELNFLNATSVTANYVDRTGKIGSATINDTTKIINANDYTESNKYDVADLAVESKSTMKDGVQYTVYAYGDKADNNSAHPFVLVTGGVKNYTEDSRFAIVIDAGSETIDEETDEVLVGIDVLYNGEEATLLANEDAAAKARALDKGDVIFFETDATGYVDDMVTVFKANVNNSLTGYKAVYAAMASANAYDDAQNALKVALDDRAIIDDPETDDVESGTETADSRFDSKFTYKWNVGNTSAVQLVYGAVVEKDDNSFSLAKIENSKTDLNVAIETEKDTDVNGAYYNITIGDDTPVYVVDYSEEDSDDVISLGSSASVQASVIAEANKVTSTETIDWSTFNVASATTLKGADDVFFAFAMVVDGDAVAVISFVK